MATIKQHVTLGVDVEQAWDAVSDWAALHTRLVPGFAVDTAIDGRDRIVTFASGAVLRENLVTMDHQSHRLVWTIAGGPYSHHNGVVELSPAASGGTVLTWTTDLLPDHAAQPTAASMRQALQIIKATLGGTTAPAPGEQESP